jgi:hypothetical protein
VNQAARKFEADGLLRRVSGPDGELVNVLVGDANVSAPVIVELATGHQPPRGDFGAQRAAERLMLDALGRDLGGLTQEPARIVIDEVRGNQAPSELPTKAEPPYRCPSLVRATVSPSTDTVATAT